MDAVLFIFIALAALISALLVITKRDPVTSIMFLVVTFFCLAVLYVMLGAQFIAMMQVIVYAGAIMVLFIFVVMMLNLSSKQKWELTGPLRMWLGFGAAAGILLVVATALRQSLGFNAPLNADMGTVSVIGRELFNSYLLPFEVTSVLLLAAIVGVVAMVKRGDVPKEDTTGGSKS